MQPISFSSHGGALHLQCYWLYWPELIRRQAKHLRQWATIKCHFFCDILLCNSFFNHEHENRIPATKTRGVCLNYFNQIFFFFLFWHNVGDTPTKFTDLSLTGEKFKNSYHEDDSCFMRTNLWGTVVVVTGAVLHIRALSWMSLFLSWDWCSLLNV